MYVHSANYITKNQIDQLLELPLDTTTSTHTTTNTNVSQDNYITTNKYYFDNGKIYFENLLGEIREVSY